MTKSTKQRQVVVNQEVTQQEPAEKALEWLKKNQRILIAVASVVVIIGAAAWFLLEYGSRKEAAARQALDQARFATQTGNLPLAATDLSRLIDNYAGTVAASEGAILLAQVRLLQDEETLAVQELRAALAAGLDPQFSAGAYHLLGTALENLGNMSEAAQAYENAAEASWYGLVSAQYLNDAARAYWLSGDTATAITTYRHVTEDYADAPSATEAAVRLGELLAATRGQSE
jgi:predicted negative regulator of RcsB-dependent stress response